MARVGGKCFSGGRLLFKLGFFPKTNEESGSQFHMFPQTLTNAYYVESSLAIGFLC